VFVLWRGWGGGRKEGKRVVKDCMEDRLGGEGNSNLKKEKQ
jgi:hypothetical protein